MSSQSSRSDPASNPALARAAGPSDPYARADETFPKLTDAQVGRVASFGTVQDLPAGTVLFERDDRRVDFFLVLRGFVEIYEYDAADHPVVMTVHAEQQFTGELDLFNDRAILVGGRLGTDSRVARLNRVQFRKMLAAEPDIAEIVMRAFILRRAGFISHQQAAVTVIGDPRAADTLRIHRFLTRNGHPFVAVDPDVEAEHAARLLGPDATAERPVVLCGKDTVLVRPDNRRLSDCLGISEPLDDAKVNDVVVVGAGPAGLAAAVYAASEGLDTLVLEADAPGGQAGTSSRIENYLGFPTGVSGQDLADRAAAQAQKFGARIAVARAVRALHGDGGAFELELDDGTRVRARSVVVATGARYRKLGIADVERYEGSGIHYAATALEAALCADEDVVVVGGGNSAGQAAVFLSRHARHLHLLIRRESLTDTMSDYLVSRIAASDRITLHPRTEITELAGDPYLKHVTWVDRRTGDAQRHDVGNVFLMLGADPNTGWLGGAVALDDDGFVRTGPDATGEAGADALDTSRPLVFAVGDVRSGSTKRVASAVGEGSIVVALLHRRLADAGAG